MHRSGGVIADLASLGQAQGGVFATAQAEAIGLARSTVHAWVRSGFLLRLAPSVYGFASQPETVERQVWAAIVEAGESATLDTTWAAAWWELGQTAWDSDLLVRKVTLTSPATASARHTLSVVQRSVGMRADDRVLFDHETRAVQRLIARDRRRIAHGGNALVRTRRRRPAQRSVPELVASTTIRAYVTSPLRTVVDMVKSRATDDREANRLVDRAIADGWFTPEEFADRSALLSARTPGSARLRTLSAPPRGAGYVAPDSELEAEALVRFEEWGLPAPVRQHPIPGRESQPGRVDFAWPEQRVIVEVNGRRWHASTIGLTADAARDRAALDEGWRPYRFFAEHFRGPQQRSTRQSLTRAIGSR